MDSFKLFCEEMHVDVSEGVAIPQPLEPLRGIYMLYQMAEDNIRAGNKVNILATNLNSDVFLWENAELLKIDGPSILFSPDKSKEQECEGDVLSVMLDRLILIQNADEYM